jgi:iron complex transport system substrate-binding protein
VPASDSLISEILRHMGFTLHQDRLGLREGGVARLESLVAMPPDYALMDEVVGRSIDNGSALLVHPALLEAIPVERRLAIPGMLTICDGPATPTTIDALAAEVRSKVR